MHFGKYFIMYGFLGTFGQLYTNGYIVIPEFSQNGNKIYFEKIEYL